MVDIRPGTYTITFTLAGNADLYQNYQNKAVNGVTRKTPVSVTVFNSPISTFPELNANLGISRRRISGRSTSSPSPTTCATSI